MTRLSSRQLCIKLLALECFTSSPMHQQRCNSLIENFFVIA